MDIKTKGTEKQFHLLGWLLFLLCAILFIVQSLTDNQAMGLAGSVVFLLGCIVFLIPLIRDWHEK